MSFRIETERLLIRPWESRDRVAFERIVTDDELMRYISRGRTWDVAAVDGYFQRQARFLAAHACCVGAVTLKADGNVIGMGGLQPLDKLQQFELAWLICKSLWGQELAPEMARAFREHAFQVMQLPRVVAVIDSDNTASVRVADKLGMRCLGMRDSFDLDQRHTHGEVLLFESAQSDTLPGAELV